MSVIIYIFITSRRLFWPCWI